jgi:PAS domain S-box-containing protein
MTDKAYLDFIQNSKDEENYKIYLDHLLEITKDAVMIADREGKIFRVNNEFVRLFGIKKEAVIGKSIDDLISSQDSQEENISIAQKLAGGDTVEFEAVHQNGHGIDLQISAFASPILDNGKAIGSLIIYRRKREPDTPAELPEKEIAKFIRLISAIEDGVLYVDKDNRMMQVNEPFLSFVKRRKFDLMTKNLLDFDLGLSKNEFKTCISRFKSEANSPQVVQKTTVPGKNALIHLQPIYLRNEYQGMIVLIKDEKKVAALEQRGDSATLAKDEFLANISHELRTPMNGILGMAELALGTNLNPEQLEFISGIKSSAESMMTLVNDILDFSKVEAKKVELESINFHIQDFVYETVSALSLQAHKKKLELICDIPASINYSVIGDPRRLSQILTNLVGNAIKFTQDGEIVISVEEETKSEQEVSLLFRVADTGIGISKDNQKIIFDVFAQADGSMTRKFGGTGLGLAICSQLADVMGGKIWVESKEGEGSQFFVSIPFKMDTTTEPGLHQATYVDLNGLPVLVLDDNTKVLDIVSEFLSNWNLKVEKSPSAGDAMARLDRAASENKPYSLIFFDPYLPGTDSFMFLDYIKHVPDTTKSMIVMVGSKGSRGDAEPWLKLGVSTFIAKPIKLSELTEAINTVMGIAKKPEDQPEGPEQESYAPEAPFQRISAQDVSGRESPAQRMADTNQECYRILIVEDNMVNRKVAHFMLEKKGHLVTAVENGEEALKALETGLFDLILMDIQMPVMDGFKATAAIRKREERTGGHMPIIAMTAHAMKGDRERCLEAGMDDYTAKPLSPEEVFQKIHDAMKNKKKEQ